MKKYIGTKEVNATPAWRVDGVVYPKDGVVPHVMNREDGYKVVYEDGYESWSPKDVFEKAYKPAETYLDRIKIEVDDLSNKIKMLDRFVYTETYNNLPQNKQELLHGQLCAMHVYRNILKERIVLEG